MPGLAPRELSDDEPLSAQWLNELVRFVAANQVTLAPGSGLSGSFGAQGWSIGLEEPDSIWVQITFVVTATGQTGSYSWIEVFPAAGGGWTDGFVHGFAASDGSKPSGTPADPLWEANLNSSLPANYITRAWRDQAVGRMTCNAGACPSTGGGG